jgi:hypothetical protein
VKKRYVLTQVSAPVIGCLSGYATLIIVAHLLSGWYQPDRVAHVLFFGSTIIIASLLGILLWGRILVLLGILSREEAKGYPFSRPWQ